MTCRVRGSRFLNVEAAGVYPWILKMTDRAAKVSFLIHPFSFSRAEQGVEVLVFRL